MDHLKQPARRWIFAAAVFLLVLLALLAFAGFYSQVGYVTGRDAGNHAYLLFAQYYPHQTAHLLVANLIQPRKPQYGPALYLLTSLAWLQYKAIPATFGVVNLLMFFMCLGVLSRTLLRLKTDPAWILLLGLLLLFSRSGTVVFLTYNIDGIYTLGILVAFHYLIVANEKTTSLMPHALFALLLCAYVRINTLFYLLVPLLFFAIRLIRERPTGSDCKAMFARFFHVPLISLGVLALLVLNLKFYLHNVDFFYPSSVLGNADFYAKSDIGVELWSLENWLWYPTRLPLALAPVIWLFALPLAIFGVLKTLPGRKLDVALFVLVPMGLYSLIIGTRYIEYLIPSLIVVLLFAVAGLAQIQSRPIKMALVAGLLFFSAAQFQVSLYAPDPIPQLSERNSINALIRRVLCPAPDFLGINSSLGSKGDYKLARRLLPMLLSKKKNPSIALFSDSSGDIYPTFVPILEGIDFPVRMQAFARDQEVSWERFDLILYAKKRSDKVQPPAPIREEFAPIVTLDLWQEDRVFVYLPKPAG